MNNKVNKREEQVEGTKEEEQLELYRDKEWISPEKLYMYICRGKERSIIYNWTLAVIE